MLGPGYFADAKFRVTKEGGAVLTVESIDLHYGAAQALRQVSVADERGKITCVLGRNGVGASCSTGRISPA